MNGKQLTKQVTDWIVNNEGGKVINLIAASKAGNADLIACIDGRYCEFEIKGKGDVESAAQTAKLNETIRKGGVAGYVRNLNDLKALIDYAHDSRGCMPEIVSQTIKVTL